MREGSGCRANSPADKRQRSYLKRMKRAVDLCIADCNTQTFTAELRGQRRVV